MFKTTIGGFVLVLAVSSSTAQAQESSDTTDYAALDGTANDSDSAFAIDDFNDDTGEGLADYSENFGMDSGDTGGVPSCLFEGNCKEQLFFTSGETDKTENASGEIVIGSEEDAKILAQLKTDAENEAKQSAFDWQQETLNEYYTALLDGSFSCASGSCQSIEPALGNTPAEDPWQQFFNGDESPELQK